MSLQPILFLQILVVRLCVHVCNRNGGKMQAAVGGGTPEMWALWQGPVGLMCCEWGKASEGKPGFHL
jgi:hypothetical protein